MSVCHLPVAAMADCPQTYQMCLHAVIIGPRSCFLLYATYTNAANTAAVFSQKVIARIGSPKRTR